jgi:putative SOS response-associated peptidase YedK
MPVILKSDSHEEWLNPKIKDTAKLQNLLAPYPAREMSSHAVSRAVNSSSEDSPELIVNSK